MAHETACHQHLRPSSAIHCGTVTVNRGKRIKRWRLLKGWDQADLSREAKVSVRTLGRIEAGNHETARAIPRLEATLGIDVDDETEPTQPVAPGLGEVPLSQASRLQLINQLLQLELEEQRAADAGGLPARPMTWSREGLPEGGPAVNGRIE